VTNSNISSLAEVVNDNISGLNFAAGIGGNAANDGEANFDTASIINVADSSLSGSANTLFNTATNFATGIGGNAADSADALFNNVTGVLTNNNISVSALVSGISVTATTPLNASTVLGGNASDNGDASFIGGNTFTITGGTLVSSSRIGDNAGNNIATGTGGNSFTGGTAVTADTIINIFNNTITVLADVSSSNNAGATNTAIGFRADALSTVTVTNSTGTITAAAIGPGTNTALLSVVTGGGVVTTPGSNIVVTP
jgi:hypothetical protein